MTLAPAEQGAVANELTLYGAAEDGPAGKLALVAPAEGTVVAIDAPAGTPVRRGQVVARLQPSPTTASTSPRQAAMRPPPTPRSPARSGYAPTGSAAMPRSSARAAARIAAVTRASLAERAGGLTVRASVDGVVDAVTPSPGDLVQAGGDIASITRPTDLRARFGPARRSASRRMPGDPLSRCQSNRPRR